MTPEPPTRACCGAPGDGQAVLWRFCRGAVSRQGQATATACGPCNHLDRWGRGTRRR